MLVPEIQFWMTGAWNGVTAPDTTPPGSITVTRVTASKLSRVVGKDITNVTFTADEPVVEYQIRLVSSPTDPISAGTLVKQGLT